jgi:hypothetical protein
MDLTAAIQKIVELSPHSQEPKTIEHEGIRYYIKRDGSLLRLIKDADHTPDVIEFNTLTGFCGYITDNMDGWPLDQCQIVVQSPYRIHLVGAIRRDFQMTRSIYAKAICGECEFVFGKPKGHIDPWYDLLDFVIAIQSQFVQDENTEKIIGWLSHLANEKVIEKKDDNFAQHIHVKTGITSKSDVKIENPVVLAPYRTFREVLQPAGKFILRLDESKDGGIKVALFGADGGAWELEAMDNIAKFIMARVPDVPVLC